MERGDWKGRDVSGHKKDLGHLLQGCVLYPTSWRAVSTFRWIDLYLN